jgi:GNAT superfamily N-acetyltransferase
MVIREATPDDAEAMSRVLIASIVELCVSDHSGDPGNIGPWTANKSPEGVGAWFENPANHLYVAEENGVVIGVGGFNDEGEIILNYVAPEARFAGVSKAMLARLEAAMRAAGCREARLTSTVTAHRFYVSTGWQDSGETRERFGIEVLSMTKTLIEAR